MEQTLPKIKHKRHQRVKPNYVFILLSIFVICCIFLLGHKIVSSASKEPSYTKCYKSVQIQAGDSLWGIAQRYYSDEWGSVRIFMEEIKSLNGISNDGIHYGNYLAIPYYKE